MALVGPTAGEAVGDEPPGEAWVIEVDGAAGAVSLDGVIEDREWRGAAHVGGWLRGSEADELRPWLWIDGDEDALRVAVRVAAGGEGALLTRAAPREGEDTLATLDDSIELWVGASTGGAGTASAVRLVFNARGARFDAKGSRFGGAWRWDPAWRSSAQLGTTVHDGWWEAEIRIPREEMLPAPGAGPLHYELVVVRQARRPSERIAWPESATAAEVLAWPASATAADVLGGSARVVVRPDALVVSGAQTRLDVRNAADSPVTLRIDVRGGAGCEGAGRSASALRGRGRRRVRLPIECMRSSPAVAVYEATDAGEQLRTRVAGWPPRGRALTGARVRGVGVDVAYYPYASKLRWRIDASSASPALEPGPIDVEVTRADGRKVAAFEGPLEPGLTALGELTLPPLRDGEHRVVVRLGDERGRHAIVTRTFVHRTFGWEYNRIGLEPEVVPPFEPLTRDGADVRAVLRSHRIGETGLLDRVEARGRSLLAAPLRLEARVAGRDEEVVADRPLRFAREAPAEIEYEASWRAGRLRARTRGRMEVDGLLWVDVEIPEQPDVTVDRLDLVIPIDAAAAPLMHVVADGVRHNYAGPVPPAEGTVWTSAEAQRLDLEGAWVPYVWLGDGERGVSFIASSMRDWVAPEEGSQQVLERRDGSLALRVSLIGRPTTLDRTRRISFALQATPTKPHALEPDWRLWQPGCAVPAPARSLCILYTSWAWGGAAVYGSFQPAAGNEDLPVELAAVRARGHGDRGTVERWLARRRDPMPNREAVRRTLAASLHELAAQPDAVIAYLSAHHVTEGPEYEVYADEWSPVPFTARRGERRSLDPGVLHATFPTRSWQDFALWHLERLIDSGAVDGLYFDNAFLWAVWDEVSGPAYRDDDGTPRPAVDWVELRSFFRRAQNLVYQKRGRWLNVSHMTNSAVAPVHTWAAAQLDGELRYGPEPFGARFTREWIRSEALGAQVGTLPIFLPGVIGIDDPARRDRVELSAVAGAAVHEIRTSGGIQRLADEVWAPLYAFGYGQPDASVHRYWDPDPPFQLSGPDADALVVSRGGEAMALVAGFGRGGTATLVLDADRLGLTGSLTCRDALSGEVLTRRRRSACRFELDDHGFRIVSWTRERR